MTTRKATGKTARKRQPARKHGETKNQLVAGKPVQYAQAFVLAVVAYAMQHTVPEASAFFDVSESTIRKWKSMLSKDERRVIAASPGQQWNPYRGTAYGLERRLHLSDKLFAELEHTAEVERIKHGYIPADILQRLIIGYSVLTDKRRLEEGAATALIAAVTDPEKIAEEGEAKVLGFRQRYSLPAGS